MTAVLERARPRETAALGAAPIRRGDVLGHAPTAGMLLPLRIFLAAGWLRAGTEKVISKSWWHGTALRSFLDKQHHDALPFFRPVMAHVIAPAAIPVTLVVMATQLLCGVLIATGKQLKAAVAWACLLNVTFILAGRVNPSAFYLVMQIVLLFAIADGALGARKSLPSYRTFAVAGLSAMTAAFFIPYIRTIEPAKVIEDPAMMMTFLGFIVAVTLIVRYAVHQAHAHEDHDRVVAERIHNLVHARATFQPAES